MLVIMFEEQTTTYYRFGDGDRLDGERRRDRLESRSFEYYKKSHLETTEFFLSFTYCSIAHLAPI